VRQMSKVLVTGGGGFIGSYVVDRLIKEGFKVLVLDRSAPGFVRSFAVDEKIEFFHGDVMDDVAVTEAAAHVDGIIHLAAVLGTQETISNPRPAAKTNILGSLNILEAAVQYDLPVVYAGVGNHWMRREGTGAYTISKTCVEDFIKMYNKYREARVSVVRPVNAYGPGQSVAAPYGASKVRKILPSFSCRALLGDDVEIYGDGTQVSDCVFVEDVARVFVETLKWTNENGSAPTTLEVGPSSSETVNSIAKMVVDEAEKLRGVRSSITHLPMRPGEVPNAVVSADPSTLNLIGISEEDFVPLREGIARTVRYFNSAWLPAYRGETK
jgi:UDP-glucose 4-epimerase